ncbi:MAG TPA: HAMP domain-containing sensor histidine kinase, partial [bacterium]|nr:HAMP domain-containing sensor histidine kinase [bacterium]
MKISLFFLVLCLALVVSLTSSGGFTWKHLFHALGWILIILFVAFLGLRRMFGPMRHLMRGVMELSNGNLDFRFPPKGRGEFDFLAFNFNYMADRIQDMMRSKDQLLLDVSHELRSPLTRLKLALEMAPGHKLKASMMEDIAEMESLLAALLETQQLKSDHGKLRLEELDLSALLAETAAKYQGRAPGLALRPGAPAVARVDGARARTVFQNLLENALKYSAHQSKPVEISIEPRDGAVWVEVRDHGSGVPPADREKIFEPFYRVDKSRAKETGGYGLGLSLCREIMRAHGGSITLEDRPGPGCVFRLVFPR